MSLLKDFIAKHAIDATAQVLSMLENCSIIDFIILLEKNGLYGD